MDILTIGAILLGLMLLMLSGGVWIAMTLAICGWVGAGIFHQYPAWPESFFGLLGKQRELGTGGATAFHLDG